MEWRKREGVLPLNTTSWSGADTDNVTSVTWIIVVLVPASSSEQLTALSFDLMAHTLDTLPPKLYSSVALYKSLFSYRQGHAF